MKRQSTNVNTIFAIRDYAAAGNLTALEIAFLMVVESHGTAWASSTTLAAEMGMARPTFYRTRERLIRKRLLLVQENGHKPSHYRVNADALVPAQVSHTETGVSHTETGVSHTETGVSLSDNTEENMKKTMKKNKEEGIPTLFASQQDGTSDASEASMDDPYREDHASEASPILRVVRSFGSGSLDDVVDGISRERSEWEAKQADRDARIAARDRWRAEQAAKADQIPDLTEGIS